MKPKFYTLKNINSKNAQYNIIFGERSSGKTYAVLKQALETFWKTGKQLAIVRRWREDFIGKRGATLYDSLVANNEIKKITKGEYTTIYYYSSRWYLANIDEKTGKKIPCEKPLAFGFALTSTEHDKSTSYPDITTICFDEVLSRTGYLPDEFVLFMNLISTIVRHRKDVKIYMLGNTINRYCPYFSEMGLTHVKNMKPGDIDVYKYGNSELTVAVEYTSNTTKKESDFYFAFDNPKLQMITDGTWEIDIYPHCPVKYVPKDVILNYFIVFNDDILHCEIICKDDNYFTFVHRKTSELKDTEHDIIYTTEYNPRPNYRRKITVPTSRIEKRILDFYKKDKVFFADNETGEIMRNYLIWCGKSV